MKRTLIAVGLLVVALSTAQAQKLTGAGATFPYPIYSKWFSEYSAAHPGVEINYQSIGSGGGIRQVTAGLVDFGASDMPMTDEMLASSKVRLIHIPTVLGAVVPIFNVPGINDIKFSGDVLADIYPVSYTHLYSAPSLSGLRVGPEKRVSSRPVVRSWSSCKVFSNSPPFTLRLALSR